MCYSLFLYNKDKHVSYFLVIEFFSYKRYWSFLRQSQYIWFEKFLWEFRAFPLRNYKKAIFYWITKRYPATQQKKSQIILEKILFSRNIIKMMNIKTTDKILVVSFHVVNFWYKKLHIIILSCHKMNRRKGQRHIKKIYIFHNHNDLKLLKLSCVFCFCISLFLHLGVSHKCVMNYER